MTSASVAVKRLQSESLQQKSLNELKQDAAELGLSKEDVKQFGNLTHKQTWLAAVENAVATKGNAITQPENIAVQRNEEQAFEPTHVLIDGEWVEKADLVDPSQLPTLKEIDERFTDWEPWMIPGATFNTHRTQYRILYFDKWGNCHCKAQNDGQWHNFRIETIINCLTPPSSPIEPFNPFSELPPKLTELTEPVDVKENLLRRMAEHGTPPEEIEKLRHEPLDYCTAYLGEFLLTLADSFQELTT